MHLLSQNGAKRSDEGYPDVCSKHKILHPGSLQFAGKPHLPAIWHSAGRSNLLAEVQDDGVPSDFVLGMTLAIRKLLFLSSLLRLTLVSAGGRTSVSLNILSVLEL